MYSLDWFDTWIYHIIGWPVLVLILCIAVWLRVNWKISLILLPTSFIALGALTIDIEKIFGRPFPAIPKGEWTYLYHMETKKNIELLVLDKDGTRLYRILKTKDNKEQLESMSEKQEGTGVRQVGKFIKKNNGIDTEESELIYYDFPHQKHFKKNKR